MAGIVGLAVLMLNSLSVSKANVYNQSARRIGKLGADSLCSSPGEIFRGQACEPCYCDDRKTAICGPAGTCTLSDKVPKKVELVSIFNNKKLSDLNRLPSMASKCVPGRLYRVACNRCICDANASLDCENLLCPSITDVKRLKAKAMSGKPCVDGHIKKRDCVECKCKKGKYACVSLKDCVPAVALKLEKKKCHQGKKNGHSCRKVTCLTLDHIKVVHIEPWFNPYISMVKCAPCATKKKLLQNGAKHGVSKTNRCPVRLDREATSQLPVRLLKAFLDPKSGKKCTPGEIYSKDSCNKCTCSVNNILRCTSMLCISGKDSALLQRWKARRRPKTKRPKADTKEVTDKDGVEPEVHLYSSGQKSSSSDDTFESGKETLLLKREKRPKRPRVPYLPKRKTKRT